MKRSTKVRPKAAPKCVNHPRRKALDLIRNICNECHKKMLRRKFHFGLGPVQRTMQMVNHHAKAAAGTFAIPFSHDIKGRQRSLKYKRTITPPF